MSLPAVGTYKARTRMRQIDLSNPEIGCHGRAPWYLTRRLPTWQASLYIAKIFRTLGIDDNSVEFPFLAATGSGGDEVSRSCWSRRLRSLSCSVARTLVLRDTVSCR